MEAGIGSYTYAWAVGVPGSEPREPMTVYDLLRKARELGATVVQVADNLPIERYAVQDLEEIRRIADAHKIKIEVGARGMTPERLHQYIEIAVLIGSSLLRFVIDGPGFEPGIAEIRKIVGSAVPELEAKHVTLAIENHDRFFAQDLVGVIKSAECEQVGICLDTVNSMGAGEGLQTVIGLLAPHAVNLHVKEFIIRRVSHKMGFVIEGVPLGRGMLPLAELIAKVSPRCRSAILEQWTPPEETIQDTIRKEDEWAGESYRYLKSFLSRR